MSVDLNGIREDYYNALLDLTFNSRPIIQLLTEIAKENKGITGAPQVIVDVIEKRLKEVPLTQKLPTLYLLDSICKLVGLPYTSLFARNIAAIYRQVFGQFLQANDVQNVERLIKLQKTWRNNQMPGAGGPIFPNVALLSMEQIIDEYEEAKKKEKMKEEELLNVPHPLPLNSLQTMMERMLSQKTEELQRHQAGGNYTAIGGLQTQLNGLTQLSNIINNPYQIPTPDAQSEISKQIHRLFVKAFPDTPIPHLREPSPVMLPPIIPMGVYAAPPPPPQPYLGPPQTYYTDYDNHSDSGRKRSREPSEEPSEEPRVVIQVPDIDFTTQGIMENHKDVYKLLYENLGLQCRQCALRFPKTQEGQDRLDAHLDMHFRQNRSSKKDKDEKSRDWYVLQHVWEQPEGEAKQEENKVEETTVDISSLKPVKAPSSGTLKCSICRDPFSKFYDDEEEEWLLRDAVEWQGKIVHRGCLADSLNLSSPLTSPWK